MSAHGWGALADDAVAREIVEVALDAVDGRAEYADVRLVEAEEMRAYRAQGADIDERLEHNLGIGVRVLVDGVWGFAARPLGETADAATAARRAHALAVASVGTSAPIRMPPVEARSGRYETVVGQDPFAVDEDVRQSLLAEALAAASLPPEVVSAQVGVNAKRQHRHFGCSVGSRQHQHFVETGLLVVVIAAGHGDAQRRSYPNSFHGDTAAAGWEFVVGRDLVTNAARVGEEAVALLTAPMAPSGVADVVIGAQQLSLQIHESAGHALELDRMIGDEANFAGTSFIGVEDIGSLRYGSPAVNITSDPTVAGTRGSFAYDDEGTPARRSPLVEGGVVRAALSNLDSVARTGAVLTGAARSDGWAYLPACFATHVYLEPGGGSLDELCDRLGEGYYIDDNRSWSIDERRLNFQFGTEVAYEVRGGKRGRLLKNFSYGGVTPAFWNSVEAVAGPDESRIFGYPCGKGEPKQWSFLSHGAAPALVRDLRIGVA
ncbi:TldD/PmbA family protein [Actinokineospora sp. NBRC 105648]|uniref:TldD/PmbA family protein n=1 Tax=Actinokineospora sp. NBRC 105648 TaxID=3032206 RepID=UPI0024A1EFBD|nr:TldD/PmbA family protein [Actinokineospora sp. NBRC 105648]GLZ40864.1 peptidase C69 [Actinokineospora sp. NBRC 105648]